MEPIPFPNPTVVRGGCKKLPVYKGENTPREVLCLLSISGNVYELERKLCDAIYGQVRAACVLRDVGNKTYMRTESYVAIKILNMEKIRAKMGTMTEDPLKELAALQYIGNEHPCLQGQIECVQDQHSIYSILNLCSGGELLDYILVNRLSEEEGRNIFRHILCGVEYLQSKGVSHRDLSLENILLTSEGYCKIIDMGQSIRVPIDESCGQLATLAPSGMSGKQPYRAPEIHNSLEYNGFAVDVWSLGIILFMILTGQQPVEYPDRLCDRYAYIAAGELRSLMQQWGLHISENAMDLIQKILQEDPSLRLTVAQIKSHPWMQE